MMSTEHCRHCSHRGPQQALAGLLEQRASSDIADQSTGACSCRVHESFGARMQRSLWPMRCRVQAALGHAYAGSVQCHLHSHSHACPQIENMPPESHPKLRSDITDPSTGAHAHNKIECHWSRTQSYARSDTTDPSTGAQAHRRTTRKNATGVTPEAMQQPQARCNRTVATGVTSEAMQRHH